MEAEEEAVDKLFEEDQDNREILDASFRNFYTTYKALTQLESYCWILLVKPKNILM